MAHPALQHPISRYMTTGDLLTIRSDASVESAFRVFQAHGISHLPVLDRDNRLIGVLSLADALRLSSRTAGAPSTPRAPVSQVMTPNLETVGPTDPLLRAAELLSEGRFHSLLVTASDGELMGILTSSDLIRALMT